MKQTRRGAWAESLINVGIGFGVALLSQLAIFPLFGIHVPLSTNLGISMWFTGISLVRGYLVRRWVDARLHRKKNK
jgi:hypothetical protein